MKRFVSILLCVVLMFSLVACKSNKEQPPVSLVGGNDISKYTIVYREIIDGDTEEFTVDKYSALRLQDKIYRNYGVLLTVGNDSGEATEYEILLGDARSHENGAGENGYTLKTEEKNIHIAASSVYSYSKAFDVLCENVTADTLLFPETIDTAGTVKLEKQSEEDFVYVDLTEKTISSEEVPVKKLTIGGVDISKYNIVYHEWGMKTYGLNEVYAAQQLQAYIKLATGVELKLVTDDTKATDYEIVVGTTSREGDVISKIDRSNYGEEGLLIKAEGTRLILTGAQRRGTIYAVYSFLEEYLGVQFFSVDCEVIYKADAIDIPTDVYDEQIPYTIYRDCNQNQILNHEIATKRKINSNHRRTMNYKLGGNYTFGGEFVHTMGTTFGLGQGNTQPCLSDEENYQKTLEITRSICERAVDLKVVSVTQNDNNNYCKCDACLKANEEEGSNAGALIRFINRLAQEIEPDYPDVKILTLAYLYSAVPPKTAPRDNVIIMYCPIDSCCSCALNDPDCETNKSFKEELEGWCELSDNVFVWLYAVEFTQHGSLPFMNFDALYDNYQYFKSIGVIGMFNESTMNHPGSEFGALRAYLLSLLMWDADITKAEYTAKVDAFIDAYYGEASEFIKEYFYFLEIASEGRHYTQYTLGAAVFEGDYFDYIQDDMRSWWNTANNIDISDPTVEYRISELYTAYKYLKKSIKNY